MTDRLITDILSYLKYLNQDCKLSVSVHFPMRVQQCLPYEILSRLRVYNVHTNPYCMTVKRTAYHKCVQSQQEICQNSSVGERYCRVCHAGVREYICPIGVQGEVIGFIAVSGYRMQDPHARGFDAAAWELFLDGREIPMELCEAVIPPLCVMLERLFEGFDRAQTDEYELILQFLNEYHAGITIDDLCRHLGRSRSHISHMFKNRSGMSVREYCNRLKLEDAKKLLEQTGLSVTEIAFDAGFNDVSYFIALFRQKFGVSPLQFRKKRTNANDKPSDC